MSSTKKFKRFTTVYVIALSAIISACGSDSGNGPASSSEQAETVYGLGECKDANIGKTKLVTSENMYYKCENGKWSKTAAPSGNGTVAENALFDTRDGQTYRTVTIGTQTWMAENLNYKTYGSYCYKNDLANCEKFGRLYNDAAFEDACPVGWHIPKYEEWETLIAFVGGEHDAGSKLKSTNGWVDNGNGSDDYGFSALPAGTREDGGFVDEGETAAFASGVHPNKGAASAMYMSARTSAYLDGAFSIDAISIRCIKD